MVASSLFSTPKNPLLHPKIPLFNGCFALFCHISHGSKRFCLYHFSGYLCFLSCILLHFALHLAPKRTAFSTILPCVLHQNALRLAAYCTAFSIKSHCILLQMTQKPVQIAFVFNKNSFCLHLQLPPFCIKTNLRENRFFAARLAIGGRKEHSQC